MKPSLVSEISKYLKARPYQWVHGGEIEELGRSLGYKASHADRRGRDLVDEDHASHNKAIERRKNEKGHVMYRYNPDKDLTYEKPKKIEPVPLFPTLADTRRWI